MRDDCGHIMLSKFRLIYSYVSKEDPEVVMDRMEGTFLPLSTPLTKFISKPH